jgi:hypothetical protein
MLGSLFQRLTRVRFILYSRLIHNLLDLLVVLLVGVDVDGGNCRSLVLLLCRDTHQ